MLRETVEKHSGWSLKYTNAVTQACYKVKEKVAEKLIKPPNEEKIESFCGSIVKEARETDKMLETA